MEKTLKSQPSAGTAYAGGSGIGGISGNALYVVDNAEGILQSVLDLYSQPVYIKTSSGQTLMNEEASRISRDGILLPDPETAASVVAIRGKKWRCERHQLYQDTGCVLYKLESIDHSDDPQVRRARECMMRLDAFFGAPKLSTPTLSA